VRRCGRQVVPRWSGARIGNDSGRQSPSAPLQRRPTDPSHAATLTKPPDADRRRHASSHTRLVTRQTAYRRSRRPKVAKLAANPVLREYVRDRLAGVIAAPDGTAVPGPEVRWMGRRHGPRQRHRPQPAHADRARRSRGGAQWPTPQDPRLQENSRSPRPAPPLAQRRDDPLSAGPGRLARVRAGSARCGIGALASGRKRDHFDHDVAECFPATLNDPRASPLARPTATCINVVLRHSTLEMLAPLEFDNSTLSSRRPELGRFAAQGLTQSDHQQQDPRSLTLARAKRCCKAPLNSSWLPASWWCTRPAPTGRPVRSRLRASGEHPGLGSISRWLLLLNRVQRS
jgi:hypothetical protein